VRGAGRSCPGPRPMMLGAITASAMGRGGATRGLFPPEKPPLCPPAMIVAVAEGRRLIAFGWACGEFARRIGEGWRTGWMPSWLATLMPPIGDEGLPRCAAVLALRCCGRGDPLRATPRSTKGEWMTPPCGRLCARAAELAIIAAGLWLPKVGRCGPPALVTGPAFDRIWISGDAGNDGCSSCRAGA
jgi:hypothetical protein